MLSLEHVRVATAAFPLEHVRVATQSLRDVLGREGSFPLERVRVSTQPSYRLNMLFTAKSYRLEAVRGCTG